MALYTLAYLNPFIRSLLIGSGSFDLFSRSLTAAAAAAAAAVAAAAVGAGVPHFVAYMRVVLSFIFEWLDGGCV